MTKLQSSPAKSIHKINQCTDAHRHSRIPQQCPLKPERGHSDLHFPSKDFTQPILIGLQSMRRRGHKFCIILSALRNNAEHALPRKFTFENEIKVNISHFTSWSFWCSTSMKRLNPSGFLFKSAGIKDDTCLFSLWENQTGLINKMYHINLQLRLSREGE